MTIAEAQRIIETTDSEYLKRDMTHFIKREKRKQRARERGDKGESRDV